MLRAAIVGQLAARVKTMGMRGPDVVEVIVEVLPRLVVRVLLFALAGVAGLMVVSHGYAVRYRKGAH